MTHKKLPIRDYFYDIADGKLDQKHIVSWKNWKGELRKGPIEWARLDTTGETFHLEVSVMVEGTDERALLVKDCVLSGQGNCQVDWMATHCSFNDDFLDDDKLAA